MRSNRLLPYPLLLLFFLLAPLARGIAQSPAGKEFIVTLPSFLTVNEMNANNARFMIEIMCPRRTQVTVKWSGGQHFTSAEVQAGSRLVLMKPQFMLSQIMQSPYELDLEKINRRAWVITTDQPVTVQALFDTNYRAENWMVYPVSSYDTAYTLVNYAGWGVAGGKSGMILMASEDNTVVRITPSVQTWGAHYPNEEYSITLQKYQVYELLSTFGGSGPEGDMTGTRIRSNRPVGVLSFTHGTSMPSYGKPPGPDPEAPSPHNEYNFSTKLMAEHQVPERYAGNAFYMMPYLLNDPAPLHFVGLKDGRKRFARDSSHVRFLVLESPTTFDTNGVRVKGRSGNDSIFNRGMRFDFTYFGPMKVESSKPVLGATFMLSGFEPMRYDTIYTYDTVVVTSGVPRTIQKIDTTIVPYGNPSMVWLPPVAEYKRNLQISIPNLAVRPPLFASRFTTGWKHYLIITAPATSADRVKVNGNPVTFGYTHKDGKYRSAYVKMLPGLRQVIESPEPISVTSYGLNIADSYGTTAGESVRSHLQVIPDTLRFFSCAAEKDTFITLTNIGSGGFRIDSLSVSGVAASVIYPAFTPPYIYGGTMTDKISFRFTTPVPGVYNGVIRLYTDANNQAVFDIPFTITRDSAMLTLPGSTIDFGALKSSESQRDTLIIVRNSGQRPLVITAATVVGQGYQVIDATLPDTLAPGASDTLHVRFTPTGDGLREAELRLSGTPCMNNVSLRLRAFKGSGATVLVQRSLQYGTYLCEIPSSVDSVIELRSIGDEPVVISDGVIEGGAQDEFTLLDALTNVTVLPGDTLRFRVRYTPGGSGERRSMLKLTTNAKNGGTIEIELVARKDTVTLEAVSDSVGFGRVLACDGALEQIVRVRNNGTIADTLTGADLGGVSEYEVVSTLPVVIQPGTEQEVRIRFTAADDGRYPAQLTLRGAPCNLEARVQLSAERISPSLQLSGIDGGPVSFDTVYACDGPQRRRVVLYNDGPVADTVYGISDEGAGVFGMETSNLPVVLQPGERDTVEITFTPPGSGSYTATLAAVWRPCDGTAKVPVSGAFVQPSFALSAADVQFDNVAVDSVVRRRVVVRNTGTAPRRISQITINGSSEVTLVAPSTLPAMIGVGDSLVVELEWSPKAQGTLAASVAVEIDAPCPSDTTIAMTGTAIGETVIETSLTLVAPVTDGEQNREVDLPITIENWSNAEAARATALRFRLRWRYTVLAPLSVSTPVTGMTAEIVDDAIEGMERRVIIEVKGGGSFPSNGELARVRGLMLVGDTDRTPLDIDSIVVDVPPNRVVHASDRDGELRVVGVCVTGGPRYVTMPGVRLKSLRPNPFREGAVIEFESEESQRVGLRVYDSYGREVARLVEGEVSRGVHSVYFSGERLAAGIYICELESGGRRQRAALVLVQ